MDTDNQVRWQVTILGAGQPFHGGTHSALQETPGRGRVLDWILAAFGSDTASFHFVGGYAIEAVKTQYPDLSISENPDWEQTRSAWSFSHAPVQDGLPQFVTYADIVYRDALVERMDSRSADIVVAVDSAWRHRYAGRPSEDIARCEKAVLVGPQAVRLGADLPPDLADAEFIGLIRFSPDAAAAARALTRDAAELVRSLNMSGLVEFLRLRGWQVDAVDAKGDWAELNEPRDIAHFVLGTKAETLARLRGMVTKSRIEDQVAFQVMDWRNRPDSLLDAITQSLPEGKVVIRSSALSEDGFGSSNAGAYHSVLGVGARNRNALSAAIEKVIASYPSGHNGHQVLVQPMIVDAKASGVVFTRTLSHGAPYHVINYDDASSATDSVTAGLSNELKTHVIAHSVERLPVDTSAIIHKVLDAVREVESLLHYDALDIEFAVDSNDTVCILQVRPIAVEHDEDRPPDDAFADCIEQAVDGYRAACAKSPGIVGQSPIFGVMPDWNPAEIIGTSPNRLAASLYGYLIMDEVWATQRAEFGYRDVRPQPLMTMFAGRPYVDVRASFNSFVPADLDDALAEKLVDWYLENLRAHPEWHDKVEFEIVPTCYGLGFPDWECRLADAGFTAGETAALRDALQRITLGAFDRLEPELANVAALDAKYTRVAGSLLPPLRRAQALLDECRRYGTLPFSHLARLAFIAVIFLRTGVSAGIIRQEQVDRYMNSMQTVTHQFTGDAAAVANGRLEWSEFVTRYGHLRPGTYDIMCLSYGDDPDAYLRPIVAKAATASHTGDAGEHSEMLRLLSGALTDAGLPVDSAALDRFMRRSIEGRERGKFLFTRNLSGALDALVEFGLAYGLDRETLSNLDINDLLALGAGREAARDRVGQLRRRAEAAADSRVLATMCELPPLIFSDNDFWSFSYPCTLANFIGSGRITAEVVEISAMDRPLEADLEGRIALIEQADPGYDWLFGRGIGGLVTLYGGANSHMAIRAAEFGLPAAIGVGESLYRRLAGTVVLELNAGNRQLTVVR